MVHLENRQTNGEQRTGSIPVLGDHLEGFSVPKDGLQIIRRVNSHHCLVCN